MRKGKIKIIFNDLIPTIMKIFIAKVIIFFGGGRKYKQAWLISERGTDARDNGYFFWNYLTSHHQEVNCFFVIKRQSSDYNKFKKKDRIVFNGTIKHYILLYRSVYLISTHILGYTPNATAFSLLEKYGIVGMPSGKRIFLQHGIIKDNIDGLKYPTVKLDLFVCGAKEEYEYVLKNYNYPQGVVQFTGLARYDTLKDKPGKRQILIMPTWRKWLNSMSCEAFIQSDYYNNYKNLLQNEELLNFLRLHDYTLIFYPHYEMQKFVDLFQSKDERIKIAKFSDYDVQMLLRESSVLITDYSSIYFDFAYMQKPILFFQFDKSLFFQNHYAKGYFDERRFGPVFSDEKTLINYVSSGKCFHNYYIDEQSAFFGNNIEKGTCCERIFKRILSIDLHE